MIRSKKMNLVCGGAALLMVLLTVLFLCGGSAFIQAAATELPYVSRIFDATRVHTVDIVANESDWQEMLDTATAEEYIACNLVIDGESFKNVAIRPKGNSSLSTVSSSESDRYSFKVEFDHYDNTTTYHGLDKLCLNNVIQDSTYMKDFLCYTMMQEVGADAPLTSYVWITVNGEDWGLYIAAEAIEESFAQRTYGSDYGKIYKPDSLDMGGGGRGIEAGGREEMTMGEALQADFPTEEMTEPSAQGRITREGRGDFPGKMERDTNGGGRNGSSDVCLVYSDDEYSSYSNIFDNAVFEVTDSDRDTLISAIKAMNQGNIEGSVNVEEVIRYFVAHNFVLNGDSYTGSMIHNYYLYEENGVLSMIPWDYNLAFGGMSMGGSMSGATAQVNSPIDSPVSGDSIEGRPMVAWIFNDEAHTELYHQVFDEFLTHFFESGRCSELIESTYGLIAPYVEKDPTSFTTYEAFQKGVKTLKTFCELRAESIRKQLFGEIPSTEEGQAEDNSNFVDASSIAIIDMGSNTMGGDRGAGKGFQRQELQEGEAVPESEASVLELSTASLQNMTAQGEMGGIPPDGATREGMTPPDGAMGGTPPEGMPGEQDVPSESSTPSDRAESEESGESASEPELPAGEIPENGGAFPQGGQGGFSPIQMMGESAPAESGSLQIIVLLGASALILLAGLLFAKFYH